MHLLELLQERQNKRAYEKGKDKAQEMFKNQLMAIRGIKNTDGFKEIIKYWEAVAEAAENRIMHTDKDNFEGPQTELRMARDFLNTMKKLADL